MDESKNKYKTGYILKKKKPCLFMQKATGEKRQISYEDRTIQQGMGFPAVARY